jgi:hypothetical protein
MTYKMDMTEFNEVTGEFSGARRYDYFLAKAAEWKEVWTLSSSEGSVTMCDGQGHECVPVWPHADFASALAVCDWSHCKAECVNIVDFMQKWVQGMARAGYFFAVFPTLNNTGVVVNPDKLREDLSNEIKNSAKIRFLG